MSNKLADPTTRRDLIAVGVCTAVLVWNVGTELKYDGWAAAGVGFFIGWLLYALGATIVLHIDRSIARQLREVAGGSEERLRSDVWSAAKAYADGTP